MADCDAPRHGDRDAYTHAGCRCPDARADKAAEQRAYRKRRHLARGPLWVPTVGSTRRLQALNALGWPIETIRAELGYASNRAFTHILSGRQTTMSRANEARIRALYDRLSMTPGPSQRARAAAARRGYAPPLAWDDDTMDDPAAQPWQPSPNPRHRPVTWDEDRAHDVAHLRACGLTDAEIAARLGITTEALLRGLTRAHRRTPAPVDIEGGRPVGRAS